jgi:hypothetical protein
MNKNSIINLGYHHPPAFLKPCVEMGIDGINENKKEL